MTLYYTLVFVLLMVEMVLFMLLILPMPFTLKKKIFTFISTSPVVAQIQYWMKICFVFILILFIDSVNRVYRVQVELAAVSDANGGKSGAAAVLGHERLEVQARKFYSQRNMYLCGFTLFLSLILNRTYVMILDVMRLEDKVKAYESNKTLSKPVGDSEEVAILKKQLASKQTDLETLKKQSTQLHKQYDELSDKYEATQIDGTSKKSK